LAGPAHGWREIVPGGLEIPTGSRIDADADDDAPLRQKLHLIDLVGLFIVFGFFKAHIKHLTLEAIARDVRRGRWRDPPHALRQSAGACPRQGTANAQHQSEKTAPDHHRLVPRDRELNLNRCIQLPIRHAELESAYHINRKGFVPMRTPKKTLGLAAALTSAFAATLVFAQMATPPVAPAPGSRAMNAPLFSPNAVRIEGTVREIFGNKFIVEDETGRKLIETGPRGQETARVAVGDKITVDGMMREGFVHANVVTMADGRQVAFRGPPGEGPNNRDDRFDQRVVLDAVAAAGFRDARIQDVKKRHAEVVATDANSRPYELHVEFDGRIRKQEATGTPSETEIKAMIERAGYTYGGTMRPVKKHMVVSATNSRGERVEIDVHRDGTIKKEKRLY